ncbi:hypothetical protein Pan216_46600 [Planctomycetes bacterium Pan216]|uniref:Uncharacterized protein n=1 Tax=Kolteria novifilia TaxID=2527975 RepID=A0A518B9X9_9BACT|nr:hypothetical protein Pan216_46600 [Planctomycetes bacterium Pan216]
MGDLVNFLLSLLVVGAALYVFGLPLLVLAFHRIEANPEIEIVDPEDNTLPRQVNDHLEQVEEELHQLDFEAVETLCLPKQATGTATILRVYINQREACAAMAVTIYGKAAEHWSLVTQYVEFMTQLQSGEVFLTGNPNAVSAFRTPPNTFALHVPWIKSIATLYRVHDAVLMAKASSSRRILTLETRDHGDVVRWLATELAVEYDSALDDGYLRLTNDGTSYVPTFVGTYFMTWSQLFPFKRVFERRRDARAREIIEELGVTVERE